MPKIEVISLIYRSKVYLDFICDQFRQDNHDVEGHDVSFRIVANDPEDVVNRHLPACGMPYTIYNDASPKDYYLNRVYRCWNFAGVSSDADILCFVNSDMAFSRGWLQALISNYDKKSIITSRLVESGRMPSGLHGYGKNFGLDPTSFNEVEWLAHAEAVRHPESMSGGLYMPVVFDKKIFVDSGGYPEGNIYSGGIGAYKTKFLRSGDEYFFNDVLGKKYGMKHRTAFNSIVYHFQSGEMLFEKEEL